MDQRAKDKIYETVRRRSTTESIVASIQSLIVQHKLKPGDSLPPERELVSLFSVSRNALREALGILGERGLISSRPGAGTFVTALSGAQTTNALQLLLKLERVGLVELCDARLLIEPELAALAAQRVTPASAATLREAFEALRSANHDGESHVRADLAFHGVIAEMSGHQVLRAMVEAVREPVTRGMIFGTSVPRAIDYSDAQHEVILRAILAYDSQTARAEMTNHLTYVRDYLVANDVTATKWTMDE